LNDGHCSGVISVAMNLGSPATGSPRPPYGQARKRSLFNGSSIKGSFSMAA
jgi:hypothetical protein